MSSFNITYKELEEAREKWKSEEIEYRQYGESIIESLEEEFKKAKIPVTFSFRTKATDSLLKKMLKNIKYEDLTDKVGARATVHFKSDKDKAKQAIIKLFGERITKIDDKLEDADYKTFDYSSMHFDIANNSVPKRVCELQLRTVCQNAWAELSHILTYKPGIEITKEIRREVNALSALMEVADNQFETILSKIKQLPAHNSTRIINEISGYFYNEISGWYDNEMSHHFLDDIQEIYSEDDDIIEILLKYIDQNGKNIAEISRRYKNILFFTQPEIVVILERLDNRKETLIGYWDTKYPREYLEDIAAAWGNPLD